MGEPGECWPWQGYVDPSNGYGATPEGVWAHRFAFEQVKGAIPEGLQVDHVCHGADVSCSGGSACPHRRCVNPAHLETVTSAENMLRAREQFRRAFDVYW